MEKLQKILIDFEDLVNKDVDVDEIIEKVDELKEQFENELELFQSEKLGEFLGDGGEEGNFVPEKIVEEAKFKDLLFIVNDRKQKKDDAIAAEYTANLEAKKDIITQLRNLIENEEHIGKAFDRFNELRETWKGIGNVSSHDYKPLQNEYSNLLEAFFYNINIYKELKEHDLKRNLQLREELIAKMESLLNEKHIKQVQSLAGTLLSDWDEIGPIHKDEWTKTRDKFKTITKKVFQRVKDYYNEIKEQREKNLAEKENLLEQTRALLNNEKSSEKDWKKETDALLNIQKEWKKIGFATKKENDKVWEDFRALCDKFFAEKAKFYDKAKSKWNDNKEKKKALIEKAEALKDSTDWKETAFQLKRLQNDWKKIGPAGQKTEQMLWKQFRAACDTFFNAKKEWFDGMDDRLAGNLKAKQDIIKKAKSIKLEGNQEKDRNTITQLMTEWSESGIVPKENVKQVNDEFSKSIDNLYSKMGDGKSIENIKFEDKILTFTQRDDAEKLLRDEIQYLTSKIDTLTKDKLQYENNLSFLGFSKGAAADKMRDDVNKKIATVDSEINDWDQKVRLIKKTIRELKQATEEKVDEKLEN